LCTGLLVVVLASVTCGGGGGGSYTNPPTSPPPSGGGGAAATITIRADGTVDPKEVRVDMGQQVRFVNQDSRSHQPQSNPHLQHTDCPAINQVGVLAPGENRMTGTFTVERACGFHDHMNPDTTGLGGTIRVAGAEGPPGPVYIKH
jgi:plastocyanin